MPRSCQTAVAGWDSGPSGTVPKVGASWSSLARKPRALLQCFVPGQEALELDVQRAVRQGKERVTGQGTGRSEAPSS